ncbi:MULTISPECIES: DUF3310 domain-containing protein [Staphylococcus]|uniref:DUF3310 domain-containing protein n=1 Tax=Staphylococcus TaxID=1279 RepID=UPI001FD87859|nr:MULTISPECIES: DUF3310 domain-containing protein [Staphylococcus]
MKISDLKIGKYVVVNDLGASKYSSGMRVIGKVVEIDDKGNYAIIESLPKHRYEITDFNDFELWSKQIADKTESMRLKNQSNDLQQRKRNDEKVGLFKIKDLKVGYKVKVLGDNMTGEVTEIADNGKSAEIQVDDGVYRVINDNYDFTIIEWNATPQYAEDMVNSPSHYTLGNHEVKDIVSLVADKYHKGSVAHNIASALEYQMRAPEKNGLEDIKKAKKCLDFAIENWDVK